MEEQVQITPEQALAHFIEQNKNANRHERRMFKKLMGIKLPTLNKPYVKKENVRNNASI